MCAVTLDLLFRRDGAEDYFSELAGVKGSICDASEQRQQCPFEQNWSELTQQLQAVF